MENCTRPCKFSLGHDFFHSAMQIRQVCNLHFSVSHRLQICTPTTCKFASVHDRYVESPWALFYRRLRYDLCNKVKDSRLGARLYGDMCTIGSSWVRACGTSLLAAMAETPLFSFPKSRLRSVALTLLG